MAVDSTSTQPITGFPEWLPGERLLELRFLDTIRAAFESYGFAPIETPAVERTETLESKGEVNKQIYSLIRPNVPEEVEKETNLSLHFDLTLPLARYVAQHYGKLVFPFRRYQIQKVWRGERPQRGRFREFYQCDIDIVGENSLDLLADAEMVSVIDDVFTRLGLGEFEIRISNRKILQGLLEHHEVTGERAEETLRALDRLPKVRGGWEELEGWLSGELSMDSETLSSLKSLVRKRAVEGDPIDRLRRLGIDRPIFLEGVMELETLVAHLGMLGVPSGRYSLDFSITRGLDYYTGTVYETFLIEHEKTLGSVCSGGRYDDLASRFVDRKLPGVGMSIGLSRLFSALLESGAIEAVARTPTEVLVTVPDRDRVSEALALATGLRRAGVKTELSIQNVKHDKQLKTAVRKGIPFAVIPWPDKIDEADRVEIRNLRTGDRELVPRGELPEKVKALLNG